MRADWRPAPARRASHRPHSATHAQSPRDPPLEPWLTASSTSHRRKCIDPTHLLESSISCMVIIRPCMHAGGQPKLATRPTGRTPRPERSPARTYTRPRPHETYLLAYLIPHTSPTPLNLHDLPHANYLAYLARLTSRRLNSHRCKPWYRRKA